MNGTPGEARNAAVTTCITFPGLCKAKESQDLAAIIPAYLWAWRKVEEGKAHFQGDTHKMSPKSSTGWGYMQHFTCEWRVQYSHCLQIHAFRCT